MGTTRWEKTNLRRRLVHITKSQLVFPYILSFQNPLYELVTVMEADKTRTQELVFLLIKVYPQSFSIRQHGETWLSDFSSTMFSPLSVSPSLLTICANQRPLCSPECFFSFVCVCGRMATIPRPKPTPCYKGRELPVWRMCLRCWILLMRKYRRVISALSPSSGKH